MEELRVPINLNPTYRIREAGSENRLRQSDAHSDRDRQGRRRHKHGENDQEGISQEDEKVHSLDLLA